MKNSFIAYTELHFFFVLTFRTKGSTTNIIDVYLSFFFEGVGGSISFILTKDFSYFFSFYLLFRFSVKRYSRYFL